MDKQQAQNLIKETFEAPFDKIRFTMFIRDLLNRIEEATFTYRGQYIPDAYKQHIESLERIGKFSDEDHKIDILVINLKKETSLERARTMQRNFIAWYLNGSRGGELKDAALVAYVSPDKEDWRFSLVKMDYKFEQTKSGRMKVKEEFTPARRWSFLVGENEKSHTAQSRLVDILKETDPKYKPTLVELEKAFDIETVTKEFFLKYRELFLRTKEELDKVVEKDPKIKADFEAKGVDTVNFAKKLLGQIIFLYFLQKKGWFGVGRDDDWGTGSKHFLRELFEKKHGDYNNFFNDILEPLFYEALRTGEDRKHEDYYYSRFNCKIPFLNGGLFDPIGNYDWVHIDILLPNKLFSNQTKTKEGDTGTGILDVFDRYNFTVKEDEPLEKEVAIDPELLGKAYEKFNAIRPDNYAEFKKALKSGKKGEENKFNKKFGVYYTPREIVHYMCQQSLINYLATELSSVIPNEARNLKEDIEALIHTGEQVSENEARVLHKGKETRTYFHQLPESIRKNAKLIDDKLAEITVCDPAVGSGAFPVGMMSEIVKARNVLSTFIGDINRTSYDFKRQCIEHSLYGVDIDPGAVEIAKLRLWLSLVVDEDDIKNIKPLPNLDYKIVCGNSLFGVEKNLFNFNLFNELEKLKPLFFNETNPTKKQEYKKQIDDLIPQISSGHTEFDFEVYFSEVFHEKGRADRSGNDAGGFDVVIANPPYVVLQAGYRDKVLNTYKKTFQVAAYKVDLYHLFIEKGVKLLRQNGVLTFINPSNFLSNNYTVSLRRFILTETEVDGIINLYDDVFEASVSTCVLILKKKKSPYTKITFASGRISDNGFELLKIISQNQKDFIDDKCLLVSAENNEALVLLKKIENKNEILKIYFNVNFGMQLRDRAEYLNDVLDNPNKSNLTKFHKHCLTGKDINCYSVIYNNRYCYFNRIAKKGGCWDEKVHFQKYKVLVRQIGKTPIAGLDCYGYPVLNSAFMITPKDKNVSTKYLLGILNSKLISFYWLNKFADKRKTFPKIKGTYLELIPLPPRSQKNESKVIDLVDQILSLTQSDDYLQNPAKQTQVKDYEKQIDRMVYQLYGLTGEEIVIIEGEKK